MLGAYEVVRKLSDGASAELFLARHEQARGCVVVEVIRPELFRESELTARFLDEAQARKALFHPNVARRVGEGTADDGRPYLVSETVGDSLADLLRDRGALDVQTVLRLTIPVCDALHYLHLRGMVHGNLQPSTVFLELDGLPSRPKLIDYGLAFFRPGRTLTPAIDRVLVAPEYLAPERVRGQRGTAASDVYALGVLLFEALTGTPPFTAKDPLTVRRLHLDAPPPELPAWCGGIAEVVRRCLSKASEDRYPTALAVREALALQLEGTLPLPPTDRTLSEGLMQPTSTGDQIGRYTLMEPIGEGAMGRVFLARHTRLGRAVALKLLKPEHAQNRDLVERFIREARAVNRIRNEHIVEIFDLVDEPVPGGRRVYCVMELLQGHSLGALLKQEPLSIRRVVSLLHQVASALEAAHRAGVVHRDIKPDNIFVAEREGRDFVKVLDFGVAKLREVADSATRIVAAPVVPVDDTAAGVLVGTPAYMAPEQIAGQRVDARVDVYALGTLLYRLLAGTLPFAAGGFEELSRRILEEPPAPLPRRTVRGDVIPRRLRALVDSCLAKDAADRPASMGEVRSRLEQILPELGEPVQETGFGWSSWPVWAAAVAGAAILAVGALIVSDQAIEPLREVTPAIRVPTPPPQDVRLTVHSTPQSARVVRTDTGEELGRTPLRIVLHESDRPLSLRLSHQGYEDAEVMVKLNADARVDVTLDVPPPAPPTP